MSGLASFVLLISRQMKTRISQIGSWKANVAQVETDTLEVWSRPLVTIVIGFGLAATALLADRLAPRRWTDPIELTMLGALAMLSLVTLWRTRSATPDVLARRIVTQVTRARDLVTALPADVRAAVSDDLLRLSRAISPFIVGALTALAVLVSGLAAVAAANLTAALVPEIGMLNVACALALAALLLPGYVRLLTLTAFQSLEQRAILVERLSEIVSRR